MESIYESEESILQQWKELAEQHHDADELVTDGLLYRGDIFYKDGC